MKRFLFLLFIATTMLPLGASAAPSPLTNVSTALSSFLELFQLPVTAAQDDDLLVDSDGDGIFDLTDACPLIPEDQDGVDDLDGCPEVATAIVPSNLPPVELRPAPCDQAPCAIIIEQEADLVPFLDCIFGLITSQDGQVIYHKGPRECIEL